MDDLDRFILEAELKDGWRATAIHEIQRDQPNRCRTYVARNLSSDMGFVKVLPPKHGQPRTNATSFGGILFRKGNR
jgi:hypothetical protein